MLTARHPSLSSYCTGIHQSGSLPLPGAAWLPERWRLERRTVCLMCATLGSGACWDMQAAHAASTTMCTYGHAKLNVETCSHPASCTTCLLCTTCSGPIMRRLLTDTELVRQCDWVAGDNTCSLGTDFAARTLGAAQSDAVAQYVSKSLACARMSSTAACNADTTCTWDPSFKDGQEGCFLSHSQQLAIQQLCVQPRYARALGELQTCMEQRRTCQCTDAASCAAVTASGACQPLLSCWLARLQGQPYDVLQLAQVQLLRVGPLLSTLSANATASGLSSAGARRRLLQPTGLNAPVYDDSSANKKKAASAASPVPASTSVAADEQGGQNQPILSDSAAISGGSVLPSGLGQLESGQILQGAGIIQAETTTASSPGTGTAASGDTSSSESDAMTYAPPTFWQCVQTAAVTSDTATSWAGIDYNSKKLTLETWLNVIRKLVSGLCSGACSWGCMQLWFWTVGSRGGKA